MSEMEMDEDTCPSVALSFVFSKSDKNWFIGVNNVGVAILPHESRSSALTAVSLPSVRRAPDNLLLGFILCSRTWVLLERDIFLEGGFYR